MNDKNKNIEDLVRKNSPKNNHRIYEKLFRKAISKKIKGEQRVELKENMRNILEEVREYIIQGWFVFFRQLFVYTLNFLLFLASTIHIFYFSRKSM